MPPTDETNTTVTRTLVRPASPDPGSSPPGMTGSLPDDLLEEAVRRLRAVALLYAGAFFLANPLSALLLPEERAVFLGSFGEWGPSALSITMALAVFGLTFTRRLPARRLLDLGLGFQVVGSFGIAMAEYWGVLQEVDALTRAHTDLAGLSFVAPWMILFTIVVPAVPWKALLAATASAGTVFLAIWLTMQYGGTPAIPVQNFAGLGLANAVIVAMAYAGGRVVYGLGRAVRHARDMGSYHLTDLLGRGGMGEVWKAEHRMLARPAAIKLIRPEMLGDQHSARRSTALARFEREAQATAALRSPHTIELYDFGSTPEGTFYYVMELLEGYDLHTMVSEFGPLPAERVTHLLRQVCHSLAEAHAAGLIHRDIKPANLYACRYGREVDFVKVLDFGLVKHHESPERDANLTAEGFAGGTPAYMAPEQATGDREVDGRADLYALGCVAYWLITGATVFPGDNPLKTIADHISTPPPAPSTRTNRPVPPDLERLILSCLAKDPGARPQTADALLETLDACVLDEGWSAARAEAWWAEHPVTDQP